MTHRRYWESTTREIDRLTEAFFAAVSFDAQQPPRYDALRELFIDGGRLVNAAAEEPQVLDVAAFAAARQATYRSGDVSSYRVTAVSQASESFGRVAQRACTFVRSGSQRDGRSFESRGAIFFQCVKSSGRWKIVSVAWDDQRPGQPLMTHPEADEFD